MLMHYRQRGQALIKELNEIECLTAKSSSQLQLLSVSNAFKLLSTRLESTRLVYASTIASESDVVDDDWRRDALGNASVKRVENGTQITKASACAKESTTGTASHSTGVPVADANAGYRVLLAGIKTKLTETDLRKALSAFGPVGEIQRFLESDGIHTNGQGSVTFGTLSAAESALAASPITIGTSRIILSDLKKPTKA
ncbi:unnamed protein product [Mesocestoides corti]|uniref:RRM domain-containing protein n=2 Tax=Mesocestoides corti TaxID=53468 RepID=A0A0R3U7Y3_MESCO|nr:unnamed protein product [Mesocestoides corti]